MKQVNFTEAMSLWRIPERLILVTSLDQEGKPQVITVGWKMRTSFNPPMFAIAIGQKRYIHNCIAETKDFVIAVPGADLARETLLCGEPGTVLENRFEKCSFISQKGAFVKSPLIENCIVNLECEVVERIPSGDHSIFIGKVMASWIKEEPTKNLILVGPESGYQVLVEQEPYRLGIVKD